VRVITQFAGCDAEFDESIRKALRATAVTVSLLTAYDREQRYHGLAVTAAVPFSTQSPSIVVAVQRSASAFSAILEGGQFCLNQISSSDVELLDSFCRSDMRDARFSSPSWRPGPSGLPYLETANTSFFCRVRGAHNYDDQTIFVGKIEAVRLSERGHCADQDPLIWINGGPVRLAARESA
jgi:flavin reductase (DIM6/NTAB) family NADH-FMN oxidoreductase RutF